MALHNDLALNEELQLRFGLTMDKLVMQDAVNKALNGSPVILDMVPNESYNIIALFRKIMAHYNYTGDVIIGHCPLQALSTRIESRNHNAISSGNEQDVRDGFFPFEQYACLFGKSGNGPTVNTISPNAVLNIFSPKIPFTRKFDIKQLTEYLTVLGFSELDVLHGSNPLQLKAKLTGYDSIIDTSQK